MIPLAEQLRPKHWDEMVGQSHLLGAGKPLRVAFETGIPHSMIFWGPPGVGKTTLARLSAKAFDCEWIAMSAVLAGVKDIRLAIEKAEENLRSGRQTLLFIDEIHRFNKSQQDALLPHTESGLLTLIGATTENPSFEVIKSLLSRAQVYVLYSLTTGELQTLLERACKALPKLVFEEEARAYLIAMADGDARRLLNLIEQTYSALSLKKESPVITSKLLKDILPTLMYRRFDKSGDEFYDQISALHKSVRGSHPDAALYWLTRMLDAGAEGRYLARRIVRMAWEDVGLADPRAIQIATDAAACFDRLGSPEGELALAQAVIYLSIAPKSNAGYMAFNQAKAFVKEDASRKVPLHLCNAPSELMKQIGRGKTYRYAHDEPYAYAAGESYFPEGMVEPNWYQPVDRGLEIKITEKLAFLRSLDNKNK